MMRRRPLTFAAGVLLGALPLCAQGIAQQDRSRDCNLLLRGVSVAGVITTHFQSTQTAAGNSNVFAGGGVDGVCTNSDQRVKSDSAEQWGDARLVHLIGRVHYTEKRVQLDADRITYYMGEERLIAEGNVSGRTETGTTFKGPRAVYLRAKAGLRARSRLDAGGRPDTWVSATDAGTAPSATGTTPRDSVHVLADSIISDNDSLVYARGNVYIERPDLVSSADSAMLDQGREVVALRRRPKVQGRGERPFTLEGVTIDIISRQRRAERVVSRGDARATSDEMRLEADTVDLRIAGDKLSRAIAHGPKRAHAMQAGRDITADSIDVEMPGQVLKAMYAVRLARAEGAPDSTKIRSKASDWFTGDTIVARFDSTRAAGDTAAQVGIRQLVASGNARSWQQAARSGVPSPDSMPAVNYMTGRVITVEFAPDRALDRIRVTDQVVGLLVQPAADSAKGKPAADSTKAKPPAPRKPGTHD